jgi:hypothetical protein
MPLGGTTVNVVKYAVFPPKPGFTGDIDYTALYAGESCSSVHEIKPAAQIVQNIMHEAAEVIAQLKGDQ